MESKQMDLTAPLISVRRSSFASTLHHIEEEGNILNPPLLPRPALPSLGSDSGKERNHVAVPFKWERHGYYGETKLSRMDDQFECSEEYDDRDAWSSICSVSSDGVDEKPSGISSTDSEISDLILRRFLPAAKAMTIEPPTYASPRKHPPLSPIAKFCSTHEHSSAYSNTCMMQNGGGQAYDHNMDKQNPRKSMETTVLRLDLASAGKSKYLSSFNSHLSLPSSPSDSWLSRAMPSISSNTTFTCSNIRTRSHLSKAVEEMVSPSSRWESIVKSSKPEYDHVCKNM